MSLFIRRLKLFGIVLGTFLTAVAQVPDRPRNLPPGETVVGKVSSNNKDSLVINPLKGGDPVTVKVNDSTRVSKDRQPGKIDEIKAGDTVVARGDLSGGLMNARMVAVVNPEMAQRMQEGTGFGFGGGEGRGNGAAFSREDWGKKFIAGEVKAINETRLTIARPDGQTQDIEVDENTSFKRGKESITLADIKAGDFVHGPGEVKSNVFVAKELVVGRPLMRTMGSDNPAQPTTPPTDQPATRKPPEN